MDYQVTHIIPDGSDRGRRIDAIYGPVCGLIYQDEAIRQIDQGISSFYTYVMGIQAHVYVAGTYLGGRWLTTSRDGFGPNNLCQLPRYY